MSLSHRPSLVFAFIPTADSSRIPGNGRIILHKSENCRLHQFNRFSPPTSLASVTTIIPSPLGGLCQCAILQSYRQCAKGMGCPSRLPPVGAIYVAFPIDLFGSRYSPSANSSHKSTLHLRHFRCICFFAAHGVLQPELTADSIT